MLGLQGTHHQGVGKGKIELFFPLLLLLILVMLLGIRYQMEVESSTYKNIAQFYFLSLAHHRAFRNVGRARVLNIGVPLSL